MKDPGNEMSGDTNVGDGVGMLNGRECPTCGPLRILSFGAGVQSSYVARMSIIGDIPPFDHVIFADTGDEPESVYVNVAWWQERFAAEGVAFHIVSAGPSISSVVMDAVKGRGKQAPIPLFIRNQRGDRGITRRQCTGNYKIQPILRLVRELVGVAGKRHNHITDALAVQTMGISWDETQRMRDPAYTWIRNDYPLVDRRITRSTCIQTIQGDPDFPDPPRSACWHCPFHSDEEWRHLRDHEPASFAKAVALDAALRRPGALGLSVLKGERFVHASLTPLGDVDFDNEEDRGQGVLWGNECEGMCGL